jgi:hypothetical protein
LDAGRQMRHKTGLSNHRRAFDKWKYFDRLGDYKRRRLHLGPNLRHNLQGPSETPGPAQPNGLSLQWLELSCPH